MKLFEARGCCSQEACEVGGERAIPLPCHCLGIRCSSPALFGCMTKPKHHGQTFTEASLFKLRAFTSVSPAFRNHWSRDFQKSLFNRAFLFLFLLSLSLEPSLHETEPTSCLSVRTGSKRSGKSKRDTFCASSDSLQQAMAQRSSLRICRKTRENSTRRSGYQAVGVLYTRQRQDAVGRRTVQVGGQFPGW